MADSGQSSQGGSAGGETEGQGSSQGISQGTSQGTLQGGSLIFGGPLPVSQGEIKIQGYLLPTNLPDRVDGIAERLTGRFNYEIWDFYVRNALQSHKIDVLIDITILRPLPTFSMYAKWESISRTLRSWLVLQISRDIVEQLLITTDSTVYADEMYEAIRKIVLGYGHTLACTAYMKVFNMKRIFYATIPQFVYDFCNSVKLSNNLYCTIIFYCTSFILLQELEAELPIWTIYIEGKFGSKAAQLTTEHEFLKICNLVIEKGKDLFQRNSAAAAIGNTSSNNKSKSKDKLLSKEKKGDNDNE